MISLLQKTRYNNAIIVTHCAYSSLNHYVLLNDVYCIKCGGLIHEEITPPYSRLSVGRRHICQ